jgi:hypothetical protein
MKVKHIIGEHKKGVRAKIYNKKGPEPRKAKKPQHEPGGAYPTAFAEAGEVTIKPMPGASEVDVDGKAVGTASTPAAAQTLSDLAKKGEISLTPPNQTPGSTPTATAEELGDTGPTTRRITPGQETPPGINRLTGKPIAEPSAPAPEEPKPAVTPLSSRYGPGYEGSPAAYTITVSGKDYKFAGRDKTGPGTGTIVKVPGGAVGIRGLAPVSVELGSDGMFYPAPTNESADNTLLQKMLVIAGLR